MIGAFCRRQSSDDFQIRGDGNHIVARVERFFLGGLGDDDLPNPELPVAETILPRPAMRAYVVVEPAQQRLNFAAGGKQFMRLPTMHEVGNCAPLRRLLLTVTLLTAVCGGFPLTAQSEQRLVLNSAFGPPISSPDGDGFFDLLMSEAFGRHGISVSVDRPPAERALINANAGIIDGDGPRIAHLESSGPYPNLIRVPVKLIDVELAVFTNGKNPKISQWEDLKDFNVGIVRGWKVLERNIVQSRSLVRIKTAELLFRMLINGRVDVVVSDRLTGLAIVKKLNAKTIYEHRQPLAIRPMFLYLHRKHASLVPKIAKTLAVLRMNGTYKRLFKGCVDTYLSGRVIGE